MAGNGGRPKLSKGAVPVPIMLGRNGRSWRSRSALHYAVLRFQMRAAFRPKTFALISGVSFG